MLKRLRQEDTKFKANLGHKVRHYLEESKIKARKNTATCQGYNKDWLGDFPVGVTRSTVAPTAPAA